MTAALSSGRASTSRMSSDLRSECDLEQNRFEDLELDFFFLANLVDFLACDEVVFVIEVFKLAYGGRRL
jgi:hypothetical protein